MLLLHIYPYITMQSIKKQYYGIYFLGTKAGKNLSDIVKYRYRQILQHLDILKFYRIGK